MAQATKPDSKQAFTMIRRGPAQTRPTDSTRPPAEMLEDIPDGTIVRGSDGTQWIAMPAVPRRWEKTKRQIADAAVQSTS